MNKCDFCDRAKNKNGIMVCPFHGCIRSQIDIDEQLKLLAQIAANKGDKKR